MEKNAAFADKYDFPYPLLCDTDRQVSVAYGACEDASSKRATRISYVIGGDGVIVQAHAEVDTKTHPAAVLESLQEAR